MALQHLRSSTADKRPTPGAMSDGQLAMNTNLVSPGLFLKDSNGDLVKVGPVHVGTTAPNVSPGVGGQAGNSKGEQWLDTSSSRYVFKIWDGTAWRTEDGEFVNASGDTMTGALIMDNQQQVRFRETTANGTNFIAVQAPASVSSDKTITLPDVTGTVVTTGDTGSVTSTMLLDGTILNADINASAAIVDTKLATIATAGKVSNSATTATNANTASAIVARDASGNFSAGTITASLTGTASNVTTNANLTGHITSVGNTTSLGSFTSAQLATALTDETGSGATVFATSPSLTTPAIGAATGTSLVATGAAGLLTRAAALQDGVEILGRAGGTTSLKATITPATLTASRTITLPDVTGTVVTTGDTGSVTSTMILDGTILNADINASAAIAGTKISPDFGSQTIATTGSLELGHATDTTLSRSAAGVVAVEGVVVPTVSSTNTLTNKTLADPVIVGTIIEDVFTIADGAAFEVDPGNGSVQLITLGASRTPKATNFAAGESITLMINDGTAYTLTWTDATWGSGGVVWRGGTAPTLATTGYSVIQFWKVASQVYGSSVGNVA